MNILTIFMGVVSLSLNYRFLSRILGTKYSPALTLTAILLFGTLYGQINVIFMIAGTVLTNMIYFFVGFAFLHRLLFRGSFSKIAFFTILLQCGPEIISCMFMPLTYFAHGNRLPVESIFNAIDCAVILLKGIFLEYACRKLEGLRQDLPAGYPFYLLVTLFSFGAIVTIMDLCLFVQSETSYPVSLLGSFFAAAGCLIVIFVVVSINRQLSLRLAEQQAVLQTAHYQAREKDWRKLAGFRHDIKNHLYCLHGLVQEGKLEKAAAYIETLTQAVDPPNDRIFTGNDFVDAILNEKYAECLTNEIPFTADITLSETGRIAPQDLCCIFGNVLDNAITACMSLEGERWIEARAFERQGQLVVMVRNSARAKDSTPEHPVRRLGHHGYGLGNVRRAVEQYGGAMEVSHKDCFTFSAMIPLH